MSKRTSASVNPLEKQDGSGFICSVQLVAVAQSRAAPGSQASLVAFLSTSFGFPCSELPPSWSCQPVVEPSSF